MNTPTLAKGLYVRVMDDPFGDEIGRGEIIKIDDITGQILLDNGEWYPSAFVDLIGRVDVPALEQGTKHDTGKPRYDLLPVEALREVVHGMTLGADNYGAHNWRKGFKFSRNYAALQRHANAFWSGEDLDSLPNDKQQYHLAAVIFNALVMLQFTIEGRKDLDDRFIAPRH